MISQKDIEILKRFSEGSLPHSELSYVCSLFAKNENNQEFEKQIQREFEDYMRNNPEKDFNLADLLERIHNTIHKKENKARHNVVNNILRWYSIAAAVLLVPLLIGGGIWFNIQNQEDATITEKPVSTKLLAPLGSRISFTLPDGTKGWLNSGSSLEYQIPFNGNRQVVMKGEAWFHVIKDEAHPFRIIAANSMIKVLGTQFNVSAYPEEKYVEVVLEEGKINFNAPGIASAIEMKPNERLVYSKKSVNIGHAEATKYSAWREGKLVFRSDPMSEVARRIERWYNVEVELMDKQLENYVIRGTFQDDSLKDVLKYLSMTSPISFKIIAREVSEDGSFKKNKVLIYKMTS